jgi:rubrerythrin
MSNTESVFDLINQCEFANENPFELRENLFPILNDIGSPTIAKIFEKNCYNSWLVFGVEGESKASVFYNTILQKLENGFLNKYYGHLSNQELNIIKENFVEIIDDEIKHRDMFVEMIAKMEIQPDNYRPEYFSHKCQEFVDGENNYWLQGTLFDFLADIVTGESYLLAAFVLFYRYSNSPIKQKIFKEFIKEESKHIAHFMHFMEKAKIDSDEIPSFHRHFMLFAKRRVWFEGIKFEVFLDQLIKDENKRKELLSKSYSTEFHRTFNKIFLKKSWQFYNIVCPDIDQDTYESYLVDQNK